MATDLYSIPVTKIDGSETSLADHRGKVLLIVNVASKCGLTPQYDALEKTYARFHDAGFEVLGFPANDFGAQEPGSNEEIAQFCRGTFGASFPMFSKIPVTGPSKHPLYATLTQALPESTGEGKEAFKEGLVRFGATLNPEPEILWNFEKFLIGRDGKPVARFSPDTLPDAPQITQAIEAELAKK
ncbi:glutathione peroxidase [Terriglobus roseus DSM 18391]|uniref:Glutathione peroxidase n=1 Tax=Terriglobus roseus (strain DSM 18391 / NRRL B-41598 / KBS 63) TaxID=926566 RepID=I3ZCG8_TERRK|nr:glutathione peroxidase [Terriglobus roseus]AFL86936.1 glutathione peroxidase [Terriglobus roseus DSM 18391]